MPVQPFHPPADAQTYRDLLWFEERLKTNAARLKRTKARYQVFLGMLIFVITVLASEMLLDLDFMLGDLVVRRWGWLPAFPYFEYMLLFVAVTTLVLFIMTGGYREKIAYANKYVLHANRSLRGFNMYFNVRAPPLLGSGAVSPTSTKASSPPPPASGSRRGKSPGPPVPLQPIPPSSNPRGELIFSSRVSQQFRDGYDRHRTAFERRREEKERAAKARSWLDTVNPFSRRGTSTPTTEKDITPSPLPSRHSTPQPDPGQSGAPGVLGAPGGPSPVTPRGSVRKRGRGGSRAGTPSTREQPSLRIPSYDPLAYRQTCLFRHL
ncbi:hypothetical protein BKA62DRAFT_688402, partial [Auriculariales sp. MPI-PUGE-AT-0066]